MVVDEFTSQPKVFRKRGRKKGIVKHTKRSSILKAEVRSVSAGVAERGRALAGRENSLGKDHPDTLSTVNDMASVYSEQGDYNKALEWYGRALTGLENSLGKDHPDTLLPVNGMASVYLEQGDYNKALEWFGRALAGREKSLGKDHPSTVYTASCWSIATVKAETGK